MPAGSPPPMRAATSTFLISLANSLPRLASMTAFLCFVVAHLEWPLIVLTSSSSPLALRHCARLHHLHEQRVHPRVAGQLRMERRWRAGRPVAPPRSYRRPPRLDRAQHLDARSHRLDPGGPDEHRVERPARHAGEVDVASNESTCRPKALRRTVMSMPAEGSAGRRPVEHLGRRAGSSRRTTRTPACRRRSAPAAARAARTRPPACSIVVDSPPGMTRPSTDVELARAADRHRLGAAVGQRAQVLADVALQGEHSDLTGAPSAAAVGRRRAHQPAARRAGAAARGRRRG